MKKSIIPAAALLGAALPLCTQGANGFEEADSLRRIEIENVVVTGSRTVSDIRHLPLTVSILDRPQIESQRQSSLLPMLSEQVPGLFVTQRGVMGFGVSDGAAGAISLRGLSGGAGRLMLLIDGHPQYMGLFGHPIADVCQSFMAERVEVLRGPASALYGSNAMGGVINIVTRKMDHNGAAIDLDLGYGSFNTLRTEAASRFRHNRFSGAMSVEYNRTDGHRPDMGFCQFGGYAKIGYDIAKHWGFRADVNVDRFNASNPGSVSAPLAEAEQWVTRGMTSAALENNYEKTSGGISLFYNWGRHKINDGYIIGKGSPRAYLFNSHDEMFGVSLFQSLRPFKGSRITAGFDWFNVGGKAWNHYFRDVVNGDGVVTNPAGSRPTIADKQEYELAGYLDIRQHIGSRLTLDAGIRYDRHSRAGGEWIPQFGASLHLPEAVELKLSVSKGFRYPTLREMYMFPPQNPDLKPEKLWSCELSLAQTLHDGRFDYGVNIFFIDGKNMIVAVPREGATPLNMNTGRIENCGIEASAGFRPGRRWKVDANYSYLHMRYPVIAAPEHKLYAGVSFISGRWTAVTGVQYVNTLYTSLSPVSTENYLLWNARVSFRAAKWLTLWVRGDNLLAEKYEINLGYPMPRTTVTGGLSFSL